VADIKSESPAGFRRNLQPGHVQWVSVAKKPRPSRNEKCQFFTSFPVDNFAILLTELEKSGLNAEGNATNMLRRTI
jgi:hypothetical protein